MKKFVMLAACGLAAAAFTGCKSGEVTDQKANREVSADGKTATETRSQMRTAPSGAQVRETETRTREVVKPATQGADPKKVDPGMPTPVK